LTFAGGAAILRASMRALALPAAAALLALAACGKSPCEELGSRICSCQAAGTVRDACNAAVRTELSASSPSSADETTCQGLLKGCAGSDSPGFCEKLQTAQGKIACGEAFLPSP